MIADMFDWLALPTTIHAVSPVMACVQIRCRQLSRTDLRDANADLCWLWRINLLKLSGIAVVDTAANETINETRQYRIANIPSLVSPLQPSLFTPSI